MSHISALADDNQRALALSTPWHQHKASYKGSEYQITKEALATPKRFKMCETPRARRLHFVPDIIASVEEEENQETLKSFTKKQYSVYCVSPIYLGTGSGAGFDSKILSDLENYLSHRMNIKVEPSLLKSYKNSTEDSSFVVKIDVLKGLRGHREDSYSLKITVTLPIVKVFKKGDVSEDKVLVRAYFIAVDTLETDFAGAKILPCCLWTGDSTLASVLFESMEKRLDCVIGPMPFNPNCLQWMLAMWATLPAEANEKESRDESNQLPEDENVNEPIWITYRLEVAGFSTVTVSLKRKNMKKLRLRSYIGDQLTEEEVDKYQSVFENEIRNATKLNLDKCTLVEIKLPSLVAKSRGVIRIERADKVKTVLSYLTSICQGSVRSAYPRLSTEEDIVMSMANQAE